MMSNDWTGNKYSTQATIGSRNHAVEERQHEDFYATDPLAAEELVKLEKLNNVWECACGTGELSKVFEKYGLLGKSTDLIDRGYGKQLDFLKYGGSWNGDIVTNPPYKFADEFIRKAILVSSTTSKIVMFLPIRYLEGAKRQNLFSKFPPTKIYVSVKRIKCAKNGDFDNTGSSAVCYCWYVWDKADTSGITKLEWFNKGDKQ